MDGISILIPTFNRADELGPTLDSVASLRVPQRWAVEVIVVDNGSTDSTCEVVEERVGRYPCPLRIVAEERSGASFARNRGMAEAAHDHLAYFDDDVRVSKEWLDGYLEAVTKMEADSVVGPVHPLIDTQLPASITEPVLKSLSSPYSRRGPDMMLLPDRCAHEIPGCNFGVTRRAAERVGGFDVNLGPKGADWRGGEDHEFGMRLRDAGCRVVYSPKCRIEHRIRVEKLQRPYLTRRWHEQGRIQKERGRQLSFYARTRAIAGMARLAAASLASYATGQPGRGLEHELALRKAWSRVFGRRMT